MGLLSIFQRNKTAAKQARPGRGGKSSARQAPSGSSSPPASAAPLGDPAEAVREARARARRRLMGATVLLLAGVIGFPLLFETQPRPIPVDLPIDIPSRTATGSADAAGTSLASHRNGDPMATLPAAGTAASAASGIQPESVSYDARPSAPLPMRAAASAASSAVSSASTAIAAPRPTPQAKPAAPSEAVARPAARAASSVDLVAHGASSSATAAAALLAGGAAPKASEAAAGANRFVVQVGAFADDSKLRDVRGKVEKIGLKTYTQAVDTPAGKRVRVRVGPFATKAEADKAASRIKGGGLPAAVLTL